MVRFRIGDRVRYIGPVRGPSANNDEIVGDANEDPPLWPSPEEEGTVVGFDAHPDRPIISWDRTATMCWGDRYEDLELLEV